MTRIVTVVSSEVLLVRLAMLGLVRLEMAISPDMTMVQSTMVEVMCLVCALDMLARDD